MIKLFRACVALASFALASALFGTEIDVYVADGQQLEIQLNGTVFVAMTVTKVGEGTAAYVNGYPGYNGWPTSSFFWYAGIVQSGVTFETGFPSYYPSYRGSLHGLSEGTYRISIDAGSLTEYGRSENGSTAYIYMTSYYNWDDWLDLSFEAY